MAAIYKQIDAYRFWYYGKNEHRLYIQVFHENAYIGSLTFHKEDQRPDNRMEAGFIHLSYAKEDYPNIIDLLRNESPIFIWYNPDNHVGGLAGDAKEPIGEGEEG